MTLSAQTFIATLREHESESERAKISRYFRGSADTQIIGVRMKTTFDTAAKYRDVPLAEVEALLESPYYEARIGAVSILDFKARRKGITDAERAELYNLYLRRHDRIDNWDLVDRAAPRVIGWYLFDKPRDPLYKLAGSANIWERRTAITATFWFIRQRDIDDALKIAEMLIDDDEELINKSVGTGLREIGKVDPDRLVEFLRTHAAKTPRVTLRYATERLPADVRKQLLGPR
ncbi:DNA alkylation repair protein [Phytoactinopolyspora mesophila]|uniref:DNA alkylation repair protein n=1 Tax=Phytoactinopolyspora mesophila TaxID=2650750 RepID=A0A7K3M2P9_9ACTN|nr:DNA alkylation repair protein [Phytoactinopolyspora mesophila]NDL57192.1 DNA alkylation repair protein [Phytoactinopolyspora mesophila]